MKVLGKHKREEEPTRPAEKIRKKIYVPLSEHPDVNFLGTFHE